MSTRTVSRPVDNILNYDGFFENFFGPRRSHRSDSITFAPRVDVSETDAAYRVEAELPGIKKDQVAVTIEDGVLSIEAVSEKADTSPDDDNARVVRSERRYGRFVRSFQIGEDVDEDNITASFEDGVLTLRVPKKAPPQAETKRIDIL
ncbi:Hsp20/alpha crystallin family protein [bacterium]|nr:Hsp20/alpha crystallin family protein [bacterium]